MGYTTEFHGVIKANRELLSNEIRRLQKLFEFEPNDEEEEKYGFGWISLEMSKDLKGFTWNGGEKAYNMDKQVKYVIDKIVSKIPDLVFNGEFEAQGEEFDDRWKLIVKDNKVTTIEIVLKGKKVVCPHCGREFRLEEESD